jgi:hypothetical protein
LYVNILFVVTRPEDWPLDVPGVQVVPARAYLTEPIYSEDRAARVFNLCKSYRYQSVGYYVSLLAAARGHRPRPSVTAMQDMRSQRVVRLLSGEIDEQIRRSLAHLQSREFVLSIYFGRNLTARYNALAGSLFSLFEAPLLRAEFEQRGEEWQLKGVRPIALSEVPEHHREFVVEAATQYFASGGRRYRRKSTTRFDLAILHNPEDEEPPSDARALQQFARAAESVGLSTTLITREDVGRLAEFDGLFIRETTAVNHHTYRIARRAEAEGMVVIDDADSILKCTNKVYLAELLDQHDIPAPRTLIVHRDNTDEIASTLGLPVVLHEVRAHAALLEVLARGGPLAAGGYLHGYTGPAELVDEWLAHGLSLSFGGMVTNPRARRCRAAAAAVPLDRLLVESDTPDHPPRGLGAAQSEPAGIALVLFELARLRGAQPEALAAATADNARRLLGLPAPGPLLTEGQ